MRAPATITCVDCGGTARLLSYEPPDGGWEPGDVVAYRCPDCGERFDMVLEDDDRDIDGDGR
jgi:Zn finger protein HypA/HybF involved in hydrogenase expression